VAAGDLNQDGWNDIAGISLLNNSLYWFPNADGNFPNEIPLDTGLVHPEDIEIVNIDTDGKPDIVVLDHTNIIVYYNLGNGNFNKITTPNDDFEYYAFSIADIDGDGFKDIIIGSGQVLVYMNDNGLFTTHDIARSNSIANNGFCFMIHTADLDGNNSMDLIIDGNQTPKSAGRPMMAMDFLAIRKPLKTPYNARPLPPQISMKMATLIYLQYYFKKVK